MSTIDKDKINIFGLTASSKLTDEICEILGVKRMQIKTVKFADGEMLVQPEETVRGKDIYIIQSTSSPVNDNLMELLIAMDALRRASAGRINVVMPYYGYARQDRKVQGRQPITARLVADMLTAAGADRVITVDIHSTQTAGFFDVPFDNFQTAQTLANEIVDTIISNDIDYNNCILVSPDQGGLARVHKVDSYSGTLTNGIAAIAKRRPEPNKAEVEFILGDVKDKTCFIVDDMIDTAGTICNAAKALKDAGAKEVYIFACHGLFNGPAKDRLTELIDNGTIKQVVVTNTVEIPEEKKFKGLKVISVAKLLAQMIQASVEEKSLTNVYNENKDATLEKVKAFLAKKA